MIYEEFKLKDDIRDDINVIRKKMLAHSSWNKEKFRLKDSLEKLLISKKYICFAETNPERYRLGSIGQSFLYDVPLYKRGHLKKFRGKRNGGRSPPAYGLTQRMRINYPEIFSGIELTLKAKMIHHFQKKFAFNYWFS